MSVEDTDTEPLVDDQVVDDTQPDDQVADADLTGDSDQAVDDTQPDAEPQSDDADPPATDDGDIFDKLPQDEIRRRVLEYEKVEERLNKLVSSTGRHQQQFGELRKEHESLLAQIKQREEEEQQQSAALSLPVYNRTHPDHDKWQRVYQRAQNDHETLSRITDPEDRQRFEQVIAAKYSPEEQQMLQGYDQYLQEQQSQLFGNPEEYLEKLMEQRLTSLIDQRLAATQEYSTVQSSTQEFFTKHQDLVDNHGEELLDLIKSGIPSETAAELVDLRHRNERLSRTAATSAEREATAKAQANAVGRKAGLQSSSLAAPMSDLTEGLDSGLNDSDYLDRLIARRMQNQ